MRFVIFEPTGGASVSPPQLGLVTPDGVVAVDTVSAPSAGRALKRAITDFGALRPQLEDLAARSPAIAFDEIRLLPPLADPAKILCTLRLPMQHTDTEEQLHVFVKSPGSTISDGGEVVLPRLDGAEVFTHNACLALVIGRRCRAVAASDWREVVFGYTAMVDVTARSATLAHWKDGLSALGSSCDTFGPLGPAIVSRGEVEERDGFQLRLSCGHELRQQACFDDLDERIGTVIERASSVMTLQPGDVIAIDGTTAGQGPLQDGDVLHVELSQVGRLSVSVRDPWGRAWDRSIRVESGAAAV
jgi:2-keto-4-pentenoate hydratase/2-oxohepta-3-ene-1,7-dioic acid hydratase in catechol pathway